MTVLTAILVGAVSPCVYWLHRFYTSLYFDHYPYALNEDTLKRRAGRPSMEGAQFSLIDRRPNLTSKELFEEYFLWGRPVIIPGGAFDWPAMGKWNISTLESVGLYAMGREPHSLQGNDNFCSVHRKSIHRTCLRKAWHMPACLHFHEGSRYEQDYSPPISCEMQYASVKEGIASAWHLDSNCGATWVAQFTGQKHWRLAPPEHADFPNTERDPVWRFAASYEGIVEAGDVFIFHAGWFHETKQVGETEALSMNMYIAQPQPFFYLKEFLPVLKEQINHVGTLATPHCAASWHALLRAGSTLQGSDEKLKEAVWQVMDAIEGKAFDFISRWLPWVPMEMPESCLSPACGC